MKKIILSLLTLLLVSTFVLTTAPTADALQKVRGYTTKRGTYVAPHYRTSPNRTRFDNYSTRGNINPYTGSKGYTSPFRTYRRY